MYRTRLIKLNANLVKADETQARDDLYDLGERRWQYASYSYDPRGRRKSKTVNGV